jgi:hypothetical protein
MRNVLKNYQRATNEIPALQLITPFIKTPYNILAEAMKRTPVAALWTIKKYMRGEITDDRFVEDMVKSSMGTAAMAMTFEAALNGTVTGGGPVDPKEQEVLKRTGWQPHSIKIGDQYFSYQRLAPFAQILGTAADLAEAYQKKDIATASQLMAKGVKSFSDNIANQPFIEGISAISKIFTSPEREGLSAIKQLQASLIPNIIGVVPFAHAARAIDPTYRETEPLTLSPWTAQIPWLSKSLPPQLTPTGEERQRLGSPLERMTSPVQRSTVQEGSIADAAAEISRIGGPIISAPLPYFRVGTDKVYYTEDERQTIAQAQEKALERVGSLINRSDYTRLPDTKDLADVGRRTKRDAIESIISQVRDPVLQRVNRQAIKRAKSEAP